MTNDFEHGEQTLAASRAEAEYEEPYYHLRGYNGGHTLFAEITNLGGMVSYQMSEHGFEYQTPPHLTLLHAVDLCKRGRSGDREAAFALLEQIFGKGNVFLDEEGV